MADTILELLEGAKAEPWVDIVGDVFKIGLPACLAMLDGTTTPVEIAVDSVEALFKLGTDALEDLARGTDPVVARKAFDDALGDFLEDVKFGGSRP